MSKDLYPLVSTGTGQFTKSCFLPQIYSFQRVDSTVQPSSLEVSKTHLDMVQGNVL